MSVNKTNKLEKQGVKRSISLFILLSMLLVSLSLASCSVENFINDIIAATEELPEGIVKTRVTLDDGEVIHIAHSENFTQDDIDFVTMLHGQRFNFLISYEMMSYSLADIISNAQAGIPLFLMHFENPYIITAYIKPNAPEYEDPMDYIFDSAKYIWAKHDVNEDIPSAIDEVYKKTGHSYLLYDCTVKKDIANGVEYNKKCKYYLEYTGKNTLEKTQENMIIYSFGVNYGLSSSKFIRAMGDEFTKFMVHTDEFGKQYLVFWDEIFDSKSGGTTNSASVLLGEYYDILYPHCTQNEDLDVIEYKSNGKDYYLYKMAQIEIDVFADLLFE